MNATMSGPAATTPYLLLDWDDGQKPGSKVEQSKVASHEWHAPDMIGAISRPGGPTEYQPVV